MSKLDYRFDPPVPYGHDAWGKQRTRMSCGRTDRHEGHSWGKWNQHYCRGKSQRGL